MVAGILLALTLVVPGFAQDVHVVAVSPPRGPSGQVLTGWERVFFDEVTKTLAGSNITVVNGPQAPSEVAPILQQLRADALLQCVVRAQEEIKKEDLFSTRTFWKLVVEGRLDSVDSRLWSHTVTMEERLQGDPKTWATEKSEMQRRAVVALMNSLTQRLGARAKDEAGPEIVIEYPREALSLRTTTVLVLGRVSDPSKVRALRVNGTEVPFNASAEAKIYTPVVFAPGRLRERLPITIEATDAYGNTASRTVVVYRGKPIHASVFTVVGREVTLDKGSLVGIRPGMAFTIVSTRDPATGLKRAIPLPIAVAVVSSVRNTRAAATLLYDASVQKGDLAR